MSVRLSFYLHISERFPLNGFPLNLILGAFMKNLWGKSEFDYNLAKITATLHVDLNTFYCCRRHKFANKSIVVRHSMFIIVGSDV